MPTYITGDSATSATWDIWTTSTSTITTNTTGGAVWGTWCEGTGSTAITSCTSTSTSGAWDIWVTDNRYIVEETEEQTMARAALLETNRLAAIQRKKEHEERKAKAVKLLRDTLDRKQKKDLDKHKHFFVRGGISGNLYKIRQGRVGNVEVVDKLKRVKQKLCAHPGIHCPDEDTMLTQKILIEHMEDHFRDIANITYH